MCTIRHSSESPSLDPGSRPYTFNPPASQPLSLSTFQHLIPCPKTVNSLDPRSFGLGVRNGLMYNVFAAHARERVEVFGFAIRPHDEEADEEEKKRVEANIEHFVDISQVPSLS
jgi:hypothetical protein